MTTKLIALLVVALAFAGLGLWGQQQRHSATKAKAEVKTLTAQRDGVVIELAKAEAERKRITIVSRELTERLKAQAAVVASQKKALNAALKANPDWAAVPVPDSVWDSIQFRPADSGTPQPGPVVDGQGDGAPAAGPDER